MRDDKENRLLDACDEVRFILGDDRVSFGETFSTGYEGVKFFIDGIKVYIIEQDGVVGLEDHQVGYLELRVDGETVFKKRHKDKHFGDVRCTSEELNKWYGEISDIIHESF